jgi:hypothetical protein
MHALIVAQEEMPRHFLILRLLVIVGSSILLGPSTEAAWYVEAGGVS